MYFTHFSLRSLIVLHTIEADELFSCSVNSDCLWPHGPQHARLPCPSSAPGVCSNSCPLSRWCHPTFSSRSSPTFNLSQHQGLFKPVSSSPQVQSIRISASSSVFTLNIQDWFPLGWTGWISMLSKGLPRVFSNTTVQKHQFFGAQLSL